MWFLMVNLKIKVYRSIIRGKEMIVERDNLYGVYSDGDSHEMALIFADRTRPHKLV